MDNVSVVAADSRNAVMEGLGRLDDDSVICAFSDGPWGIGSSWDEVRSTRGWLRPAMFADDFDDGDATGWAERSGSWAVAEGLSGGDRDFVAMDSGGAWAVGTDDVDLIQLYYHGIHDDLGAPDALSLTGETLWSDFELTAEMTLMRGEAGLVFFHSGPTGDNYYLFSLESYDDDRYTSRVRKYAGGSLVTTWPTLPDQVLVPKTTPMYMRVTVYDGQPVCYANGARLAIDDATPYTAGKIGLQVIRTSPVEGESGWALFDNIKVFGGASNGYNTLLFEDPLSRLNLDGTPFMWRLFGEYEDPPDPPEPAWTVVDGGAGHGKVLQETASGDANLPTLALRGDPSWINDDETDYMNYHVEANVRLFSVSDRAGVCLRAAQDDIWPGYRTYELRLDPDGQQAPGQQPELQFGYHYYVEFFGWYLYPLHRVPISDPCGDWHTIAVEGVGDDFHCYLDGNYKFTYTVEPPTYIYIDGLVGLWVQTGEALYDNVKVVDLR